MTQQILVEYTFMLASYSKSHVNSSAPALYNSYIFFARIVQTKIRCIEKTDSNDRRITLVPRTACSSRKENTTRETMGTYLLRTRGKIASKRDIFVN
jgi:hypothetical protein